MQGKVLSDFPIRNLFPVLSGPRSQVGVTFQLVFSFSTVISDQIIFLKG